MNLFITGTGTDVGKTFVACGILRALTRAGRPANPLKPVLTGYDPSHTSDPAHLLAAIDQPATPAAIAGVSPWRFTAPLSPNIAAARENRTIDFDALIATCRQSPSPTLIEGIGGVMVPLTDHQTVLDWISELNWPILLVAGSYLGTISHTLTALTALRGLDVAAIVVNHAPSSETIATIKAFTETPVIVMPMNPDEAVFDDIVRVLG